MNKSGTQIQKLLLVFDLPKTLILAEQVNKRKYFDQRAILETLKPDDKYQTTSLFWRKGRADFLDFFFTKNYLYFDVGVWSCLDRERTGALTKSFFGRHYRNLLFISASNREPYEGILSAPSYEPLKIERDLPQITSKFPQYDLSNTVMISVFPNLSELCQFNDIVVPQYCPTNNAVDFNNDLTLISLTKYLHGLSILLNQQRIQDVRPTLKAKNFDFLRKRIEHHDQQFTEFV